MVAFTLSGTLNASATYAVVQSTRSLSVVVFFDCIQPVDIVFQLVVSRAFLRAARAGDHSCFHLYQGNSITRDI